MTINYKLLLRDLEQELLAETTADLEFEMEIPVPGDRCPVDSPTVIRGFGRFDNFIPQLPREQQDKLGALAAEIANSQSGANPVTQVIAIGHADLDASMESRFPGFLQYVSEQRAHAVLEDLNCRFIALVQNSPTPSKISGRDWVGVGRGARALAISAPRTDSERKCNRRVEVVLVRSARRPQLNPASNLDMVSDSDLMLDLYHAALQGTSGQYERAHTALEKASEIAEKALNIVKLMLQERIKRCPALPDLQGFTQFFKDALQGTASKYSDTDVVVDRAAEIAQHAGFKIGQAQHRLEWKFALLPQEMSPDCEIVLGKVPGPPNHVLCRPHGHVLDTSNNMVIAHDINEYVKSFPR